MKSSILVFRTGQLGDTLVALPALRAIRSAHPSDNIILLTDIHPSKGWVFSGDVIRDSGLADEVLSYNLGGSKRSRLLNLLHVVRTLWPLQVHVIYSLTHDRSPLRRIRDRLLLTVLSRCFRFRAAPERSALAQASARAFPEWKRLGMAVPGFIENEALPPYLFSGSTVSANVQGLFDSMGLKHDFKLLAVGPGSKMQAKIWPKEHFISLVGLVLGENPNVSILVLGGVEDKRLGDEISASYPGRCWNLAGSTTIIESLQVLERCVAYVGNDTGTMHLAAAAGIQCVAIFSARDLPGKWEPYGRGHSILRKDVPCAGCMLEECTLRAKVCLTSISVDEVFLPLQKILQRTTSQVIDMHD